MTQTLLKEANAPLGTTTTLLAVVTGRKKTTSDDAKMTDGNGTA